MYLVTQGHTHKRQPTNQMSKHSSQLSSPHHLSTHRLLPDVSLVPEEVCLHGALGWNRPHLTSPSLSDDPALPTGYSTWHTNENERHTQEAITCKLPRNCDAHITPKPLNVAAVCLLLRTRTQPNPGVAGQFKSRCCDEMMDVGRCLSMVTEDKSAHTAMLGGSFPSGSCNGERGASRVRGCGDGRRLRADSVPQL